MLDPQVQYSQKNPNLGLAKPVACGGPAAKTFRNLLNTCWFLSIFDRSTGDYRRDDQNVLESVQTPGTLLYFGG